jgi:UDP-N-acetylmuramoyl-L-alanyl-D-glutamate--2,6-diaminopimelate ligase
MKLLKDILYRSRIVEVIGSTQLAIDSITMDSRQVKPMGMFVAVKGFASDGHVFIEQSIAKGAVAIVCEELPKKMEENITYIKVMDSHESLGLIASNFYDNPSEKIKVIAVTGTNGKTTTATLLYRLFSLLGYKSGLLSTVVNRIGNKELDATHTTPDAVRLNELLSMMVAEDCQYCFMEASSHAIHQKRIAGTKFRGAVFTNITHDHLDYHKTFKEYIQAKKALFDQLPVGSFALVNRDDRNGLIMLEGTKATRRTYALQSMADYKAKVLENQFSGLHMVIDNRDFYSRLIGGFNAYNLLAVYSVACEMGQDPVNVLTALSQLESVEGRFQHIKTANNITAIIDYAHTPDALKNVLSTIAEVRTGNEQVITVVGCGGDRDKDKRPVMAAIAIEMSDRVILTSDNPRSEDPDAILSEMRKGVDKGHERKVLSLTDRAEAIKLACSLLNEGDILLVAGKGHEKYQEIKGVKYPFDDYKTVGESLQLFQK